MKIIGNVDLLENIWRYHSHYEDLVAILCDLNKVFLKIFRVNTVKLKIEPHLYFMVFGVCYSNVTVVSALKKPPVYLKNTWDFKQHAPNYLSKLLQGSFTKIKKTFAWKSQLFFILNRKFLRVHIIKNVEMRSKNITCLLEEDKSTIIWFQKTKLI